MLTTLHTETLENYSFVLPAGSQLHSFVTLQPSTPYFLLSYSRDGDSPAESSVLMWRLSDVLDLIAHVKNNQGQILNFSLLSCPHKQDAARLSCRDVRELWVSSSNGGTSFLCQLLLSDGGSRIFHDTMPSSDSFQQMKRLY